MGILGGPGAEPARSQKFKSIHRQEGAHYNIYEIDPDRGVDALREMFPLGEANTMNFVLFSTSGVHGSYATIEEIEASLEKYGEDPDFGDEEPDDWWGSTLTVLIVQPRLVCMRYGNIKVSLPDIPFLKQLRVSSWAVVKLIGEPD